MPATTERNPDNGIIEVTFTEGFGADLLKAQLTDYFANCPRGAHLFIVVDFTALEADPDPQPMIDALIELCGNRDKIPVLVGVVAKGDMGYAPGRTIHPFASRIGFKVRVFQGMASATQWLLAGLD